jgi:hypothetical protein
MKKMLSYSLAAFIFVSGCATVDHTKDEHEEKALKELTQAITSAEKGDATGVVDHTERAKKHLIEENREHPHTHPFVSIYGQFPKAEHDVETFEEMDKTIGGAKKGNLEKAKEAAKRASMHLQQRAQSK